MADEADPFDAQRPRLTRIAYRMLGSVAEAEDVVQDTWLRWSSTEREGVREPGAFLARIVTRLCLDHLKSARARRETYIGPWLPEPVLDAQEDEDEGDDITMALMLALERLSPLERAAFLLHDVFGEDFDEVAKAIAREPAACRQLAARARAHVHAARPRYRVPAARARDLTAAFYAASRSGDVGALQSLLSADVIAYTDGGGKQNAALNPIYGWEKVTRFFEGLARKHRPPGRLVREGRIDGLPGFVTIEPDGVLQTTALALDGEKITAIYVVRNPDKLRHIAGLYDVDALEAPAVRRRPRSLSPAGNC